MAAATETRKPPATPVRIAIDAIIIGRGRRKATNENVSSLMTSITAIGLRTPISVLSRDADGYHPLVAGRHRLEACRALGHTEIEAWVIKDKIEAEKWEIAENLHRAELTALQRSISVGRWIKLTAKQIARDRNAKPAVQLGPLGHKQQPGGISAAARELGISETSAKRSVKIAERLAPTAQKEAERLGLANNQRVLERAAGLPGEHQVHALQHAAKVKQQRQETKAKIAANHAANAAPTPLSARDAFEVWYHRLDPTWQGNVRTWLREIGADDYADKLDRLAELMARDAAALN